MRQETNAVAEMQIDVKKLYHLALESLGEGAESLKGVLGLSSRDKTPEPLEKGILRAKHGTTSQDGTGRYDLTDRAPHPCPAGRDRHHSEVLQTLGLCCDMLGDPLTRPDQVCELRIQDITCLGCGRIPPEGILVVDELLAKFYHLNHSIMPKPPRSDRKLMSGPGPPYLCRRPSAD